MTTDVIRKWEVKGKLFGYVKSDLIFRKQVNSQKHKMRMFNGYGIQLDIYNELISMGVTEVRILETDTKHILASSIDTWKQHGINRDYSAGAQRFLSVSYMKKDEPK